MEDQGCSTHYGAHGNSHHRRARFLGDLFCGKVSLFKFTSWIAFTSPPLLIIAMKRLLHSLPIAVIVITGFSTLMGRMVAVAAHSNQREGK